MNRRLARLAVLALAALAACKTTWELEDRRTPVVVVVDAPAAASAAFEAPLAVTVGDRRAIEGVVRFPAGTTRLTLPPVVVRAGPTPVTVALGGRVVASTTVEARTRTWVRVTLQGGGATVVASPTDPSGS